MQPGRVRLHYSDGQTAWRNPPTVLEIGTEVRRGGRTWIVASIQPEGDVVTITLRGHDEHDMAGPVGLPATAYSAPAYLSAIRTVRLRDSTDRSASRSEDG